MAVQEVIIRYKGDITQLKKSLGELKGELIDVQKVSDDTGKKFGDLGSILKKGAVFLGVATGIEEATRALIRFGAESIQVAGALDKNFVEAQKDLNDELRRFKEQVGKELLPASKSYLRAMTDLVNVTGKLLDVIDPLLIVLKSMPTSLQVVSGLLRQTGIAAKQGAEGAGPFKTIFEQVNEAITGDKKGKKTDGGTVNALEEMRAKFKQMQAENTFGTFTDRAKDFNERVQEMTSSISEALSVIASELFGSEGTVAETISFADSILPEEEVAEFTERQQIVVDNIDLVVNKLNKVRETTDPLGEAINSIWEISGQQSERFGKFLKSFAVVQIAIDNAIAIAEAIKSAIGIPFPANLPAVATTLALVASTIAQAKSTLASAGEVPEFGEGGWIGGKPHSQGGTLIRAEKDEFMIKALQAQKHSDWVEAINEDKLEQYISSVYLPKLQAKAKSNDKSFTENLAASLMMQSGQYDDNKLRRTLRDSMHNDNNNTKRIVEAIKTTSRRRGWN